MTFARTPTASANRYVGTLIVPHPDRIRDCDAADVAEFTLERIADSGRTLALFLHSDGRVELCEPDSWRFRALTESSLGALVGVYCKTARKQMIADDLKAREG